jgi:hypothetical protein
MRRGTHALWALYALLALFLLRCALVSHQHNSPGYTAMFAAASIGAALAIVHTSWLLDEHRAALNRLDTADRRPRLTTRQDVQVRQILGKECCETWWATAGAEHDPEHCTRKDQTT